MNSEYQTPPPHPDPQVLYLIDEQDKLEGNI